MSDQHPAITDRDHYIDRDWFADHPNRTCYARQFRDGWVLIVKRIERNEPRQRRAKSRVLIRVGPDRPPPTRKPLPMMYFRAWAKLDAAPQGENACLIAWRRAAYPDARP
jgi:hypothetical protein